MKRSYKESKVFPRYDSVDRLIECVKISLQNEIFCVRKIDIRRAANAKKSACLCFVPGYKNASASVTVCVNWVTSARYLGVCPENSYPYI